MKTNPVKNSTFSMALAALSWWAATTSVQAQTECTDTNGVKYLQPPNLAGYDVSDSLGYVLADDFICTDTGPITGIHIWGSWLNNVHGTITNFVLAIYSDVPAVTNVDGKVTPSEPGRLLWSESFSQGQFVENEVGASQEQFISPASLNVIGPDSQVWLYCFFPTNPFVQTGSPNAPTVYWLAAYAEGQNFGPQYNETPQYGWKTTFTVQNDTSVFNAWGGAMPGSNVPWTPNTTPPDSPAGAQPIDLAFELTTATNLTPTVCVETNGAKYVQWPNVGNGFDVWDTPYVLADDFVCTNPSAISDIHLWGSWLNDIPLTNSINFWLGIYNDVPSGPGSPYSHPGTNLLWQQWFSPGQYAETIWTENASEQFLNPGATNILGGDSEVWYYCFYPTNPFVQLGTVATNKTYWLAAYAQLPVGIGQLHGWKTATNVLNDAGVWASWPGTPPTNNPGWTPTVYQPPTGGPQVPLDLAFMLTTPTNCSGPVNITY